MADSADALIAKVRALGRRHETLRAETQRAETAEAMARARLGEALIQALAARSEAEAAARAAILARYIAVAAPRQRPGRRNRLRRGAERMLARLGRWGQALVIAASGVWAQPAPGWRGCLRALPAMAAYAGRGADPAAGPATLFDQDFYLRANPDVAAAGASPLVHYLLVGAREGRAPHPLFDAAWYSAQVAAELGATGLSALEHYLRLGAAQGLSPHPLFDPSHYLPQAPELLGSGEDPLSHYLRVGGRRGLAPHPLFRPAYYGRRLDSAEAQLNPLLHYLAHGSARGLKPHPLFDPNWYRSRYGLPADLEPLRHFVVEGGAGRLSPGPWFDAERYIALRGDARPPALDVLTDYLRGGAWAVAEPQPGFPAIAWLCAHPELAAGGLTPLEHWAGKAET